jgi:hypothetical protein
VAEREGFELPVRFRTAKPRLIRKLQNHIALQRILRAKITGCAGNGFGSDSPYVRLVTQEPAKSAAEIGHFRLVSRASGSLGLIGVETPIRTHATFPVSFVTSVVAVRLSSQVSIAPGRMKGASLR